MGENENGPAVTPALGSPSTAPLDERIKQLEEELARRTKVDRITELEEKLHAVDAPPELVELVPEAPTSPRTIELHQVHCDACGHPYGALEAAGAVVLCRDGCAHSYLLPAKHPGRKRGAARREHSSDYLEHRRVFCGMCHRALGHVRVTNKGAPTPVAFCSKACVDAWEEQGNANPTGGGRAR